MAVSDFFASVIGAGRSGRTSDAAKRPASPQLADALSAIDEAAAQRKPSTLMCYQCGRKYDNRGTFLRGSACPDCRPTAREAEAGGLP